MGFSFRVGNPHEKVPLVINKTRKGDCQNLEESLVREENAQSCSGASLVSVSSVTARCALLWSSSSSTGGPGRCSCRSLVTRITAGTRRVP